MQRQLWTAMIIGLGLLPRTWALDPLQPMPAQTLATTALSPLEPGWRVGPVDVHPRVTAGVTYDDNIELSQTNRLDAFIGSISPELTAIVGNRAEGGGTWLSLNYRPTVLLFSDHTNNDTVDHLANMTALWTLTKFTFGVSQEYNQTHGAIIEVGQRVRQETYKTDFLARYALGEKTSLEVGPRLTITDIAGFQSTRDWGVDAFLNHALGAKLTGGIGGSAGYFTQDQSPDQWYQRGLLRLRYAVATKADITAAGGVEVREYDGDRSTKVQPVFGISGVYRATDTTTLTLEAHRREEASVVLVAQDYVTTGGSAGIRQQVAERFYVSLSGGYEHRDYAATATGVAANRADNYWVVRPAAGVTFARHCSASVFYQYQTSQSTAAGRDFHNSQIGFQGTWGF